VGSREAFAFAVRRVILVAAFCLVLLGATNAGADPFRWPQPGGPGTPVVLTFSFSNLLEAELRGERNSAQLRAATLEGFELWSHYAPLHFIERTDSGPAPSDWQYAAAAYPDIRIGVHQIDGDAILGHAFLPYDTAENGLAGDIHINSTTSFPWSVGGSFPAIDFLEVITHEIGHALGLSHILYADAVMQPFHAHRFHGLGDGYLLAPDIQAIRALYGPGVGSVQSMPEPSSVTLLSAGLLLIVHASRRRGGLAVDAVRVFWMSAQGNRIWIPAIPAAITPGNRLLLGPPELPPA